ncbi:hypothetical protein BOTBODRAFT_148072 [Botryobasidium botryosum FD-172 SS1]|uniref:Uncharacterized protein n=1 Tax=Botryobasidium botryosum (strain FD-172 SS1) TaxID=930990 RepID=A0A067M1K9_BOTB1|nr:hypothetical protein BOTBODRAFT_148072 [Botryobasidium botryosum FD-172 SS1]
MEHLRWAVYVVISLVAATSSAASSVRTVNATVDDADARVVYSGVWNDQSCGSCPAKPNASMVTNGTWHDGTQTATDSVVLSASLTFTGTDIYVFGILAPSKAVSELPISLNFLVDGIAHGNYTKGPSAKAAAKYHYNVTFFAGHGLTNETHTLTMALNKPSYVLLDSFVYTYVTSQNNSHHPPHHRPPGFPTPQADPTPINRSSVIGPAVGGAVGGTICVIALAALALCYCRRKERTPARMRHSVDMLAYETNQPASSSGIDASSYAIAPTRGYMPVPTRQLPEEYSNSSNSLPSYAVNSAQWAGRSGLGPHAHPFEPSALPLTSNLPLAEPLPQLSSTRAMGSPPAYGQPRA